MADAVNATNAVNAMNADVADNKNTVVPEPMPTIVWAKFYYEGDEKPVNNSDAFKFEPKSVNDLKEKVHALFSIESEHCTHATLKVYPPDTAVPDRIDEAALAPYDPIPPGMGIMGKLPLIVVAPNGKNKREDDADVLFTKARPPTKKRKIRDVCASTRVQRGKFVDLVVGKMRILTPADKDTVRYYGREGIDEIFTELIGDDSSSSKDVKSYNDKFYNISLIGAPGSGKSKLVWAAAEYLASTSKKRVMWVGRCSVNSEWTVRLFEPSTTEGEAGGVYELINCPDTVKDILMLEIADIVDILIVDAFTNAGDSASGGAGGAAFDWTGNEFRRHNRRVIHVSSLGSYAVKQTQRDCASLRDISMPNLWTRQDFVDSLKDEVLKRQVCISLGITYPTSMEPDELVDQKIYYSGINARWFFNHTIKDIKNECQEILDRLSATSTVFGDESHQAVNSAVVSFWKDDGPNPTKVYTSNYVAWLLGSNESVQSKFFGMFPRTVVHPSGPEPSIS
eukprot:scaffold22759_cov54-Attheya_sp.AAC.5